MLATYSTCLDAKGVGTTTADIGPVAFSHHTRLFLGNHQIGPDNIFDICLNDSILLLFRKFYFQVPFYSVEIDDSAFLIQKYELGSEVVCFKGPETFDIDSLLNF